MRHYTFKCYLLVLTVFSSLFITYIEVQDTKINQYVDRYSQFIFLCAWFRVIQHCLLECLLPLVSY